MLESILSLDRMIFTQINSVWTHPWMDAFFPFITDLHKTLVFKLIFGPSVFGLFIWARGLKKGSLLFVFALLSIYVSDGVGNYAFKKTVQRPRPAQDAQLQAIVRSPFRGYSFVSNHAANNFAFATFVSMFFPPARILVFTVASLVCYSRVYNGVHYPTDVLCGALLGALCGYLMSLLCRLVLRKFLPDEVKK